MTEAGRRTAALLPPQVELVPIDTLRPDAANPRRISDAELEALTRSIREFGFIAPSSRAAMTTSSSAVTSGCSRRGASAWAPCIAGGAGKTQFRVTEPGA